MKFKKFDFNNIFENLSTKIVYTIGNARGGSTISNTLVNVHPKIYEINWNDKFFMKNIIKSQISLFLGRRFLEVEDILIKDF